MEWEPGAKFGNLEIEAVLGRGSFGTVLLARDVLLQRQVALKVFNAAPARRDRDRILAEARLIGRLEHPSVVRLYRVHETDEGGWAIEMEYLDGGTLDDVLATGDAVLPSRSIEVGRAIAAALATAHAGGIVHGDVKPSNVLLGRLGGVKLADFGIAAIAQESGSDADQILGTPRFMSPEVFLGGRCTPASDAWSLGVILYQLLSGAYPFPADHMGSLFHAIQNRPLDPLVIPAPPRIADAVGACLERDPSMRPSLEEVRLAFADPSAPVRSALRRAPAQPPVPIPIGREAEHRTILDLVRRASDAGFTGLLLRGEPGIGKSFLMQSVGAHASSTECDWMTIRSDPSVGLLPVLTEAVRRGSGTAAPMTVGSSSMPEAAVDAEPRFESRHHLIAYLADLLRHTARRRTIGILIEDVQRADPEDLSTLRSVGEILRGERVFLALTERAADRHGSSASDGLAQEVAEFDRAEGWNIIGLEPMPAVDIYALLENAGYRVDARVGRRIGSIAEGNPLFALELIRHFIESGAVESAAGEWRPGNLWEQRQLPRRVRDLVSIRLQGLDREDRELLEFAAADGEAFDADALATILDLNVLDVLRRLQWLFQERGLVIPWESRFRFGHAVVREALYGELAPALRREIHRRLAGQLEAAEVAEADRLGRHWRLAGETDRARPHLLKAAAAAGGRQEIGRMIDLCTHAGVTPDSMPATLPPDQLQTYIDLAYCYSDAGREEEARKIFDALEAAARAAGNDELLLRIRIRKAKEIFMTEGPDALDIAQLQEATQTLPDCPALGTAHYVLGLVHKYRGELDEAEHHARQALEGFKRRGQIGSVSNVYDQLGSLALRRGNLDEARKLYLRAETLSARVGRHSNAAISAANAGLVSFQQGKLEDAATILRRSIAQLRVGGVGKAMAHAQVALARVELALGRLDRADALLEEAGATLAEVEQLPALVALRIAESSLALLRGQWERQHDALASLRELGQRSGNPSAALKADAHELVAHVLRGRLDAARMLHDGILGQARDIEESATTAMVLERVAEAVLFGLDPDCLEAWNDLDAQVPPFVEALRELARASRKAPVSRSSVDAAAAALAEHARADRAAYLQLLAAGSRAIADPDAGTDELQARARESGFLPLARWMRDAQSTAR